MISGRGERVNIVKPRVLLLPLLLREVSRAMIAAWVCSLTGRCRDECDIPQVLVCSETGNYVWGAWPVAPASASRTSTAFSSRDAVMS